MHCCCLLCSYAFLKKPPLPWSLAMMHFNNYLKKINKTAVVTTTYKWEVGDWFCLVFSPSNEKPARYLALFLHIADRRYLRSILYVLTKCPVDNGNWLAALRTKRLRTAAPWQSVPEPLPTQRYLSGAIGAGCRLHIHASVSTRSAPRMSHRSPVCEVGLLLVIAAVLIQCTCAFSDIPGIRRSPDFFNDY